MQQQEARSHLDDLNVLAAVAGAFSSKEGGEGLKKLRQELFDRAGYPKARRLKTKKQSDSGWLRNFFARNL